MEDPICLAVISDPEYFIYLKILLVSAKKNLQPENYVFTIILINFSNPIKTKKELQNLYSRINFIEETVNFENVDQKIGYCINKRIPLLQTCLEEYQHVLFLDADTIIRENLNELTEYIRNHDIVCYDAEEKEERKFQHNVKLGVLGFRKSNLIHQFLEEWLVEDKKLDFYKVHSDQDSFNQLISNEYGGNRLKIKFMSFRYIDYVFSDVASAIWVGKGDRKHQAIFLGEMLVYAQDYPRLIKEVLNLILHLKRSNNDAKILDRIYRKRKELYQDQLKIKLLPFSTLIEKSNHRV